MNILDAPKLHDYKEPLSDKFFKVIAKADFETFKSKAIQKLIDYKYLVIRDYTMKWLFYPFCAF